MLDRNVVEDVLPLTPLQRGMLVETISGEGDYVIHYVLRGGGPNTERLDVASFKEAWELAVQKHAALRAAFFWEEFDQPIQIIKKADKTNLKFSIHDWSAEADDVQEERIEELVAREHEAGIDLHDPPLLRVHLADLGDNRHCCVITRHHVVFDGIALMVLLREISHFYRELRAGREPTIEPRDSLRPYMTWLQKQSQEELEAFWTEMLQGAEPTLLPEEKAEGGSQSTVHTARVFQRFDFDFSDAWLDDLQAFASATGITVISALNALWAIVLGRHTNKREVVYGVVVSGRDADVPGIHSLVGMFINVLPVRVDLDPQKPVQEYFERVHRQLGQLRRYGHCDYSDLRRWAQLDPTGKYLEKTMMTQVYLPQSEDGDDEYWDVMEGHEEAHSSLQLVLRPRPDGRLYIKTDFDQTTFSRQRVEALLHDMERLGQQVFDSPELTLGSLNLVGEQFRSTLLEDWGRGKRVAVPEEPLHRAFEEQAARHPDRLALSDRGQEWNYEELNSRANRIANRLREQGIGPDVTVGVSMERSYELVASLLGILKAGGAYVAASPTLPSERLRYMLHDAGVGIVLCDDAGERAMGTAWDGTLALVDDDWVQEGTNATPEVEIDPHNLAYISYTSGSTGRPKGVQVPHGGVVRYIEWCRQNYSLGEGTVVPMMLNVAFDLAVTLVFGPLSSGGAIEIIGGATDGDALVNIASETSRTYGTFKGTPTHLHLMTEQMQDARIAAFAKTLVLGGEQLTYAHLRRWRHPNAAPPRIFNEYGPTETVVGSCVFEVTDEGDTEGAVPIGRPVFNEALYVLDSLLELVSVGTPGGLFIGGECVTRGYKNRPSETALRFLPDPYAVTRGARMYMTGDVAAWSADGQLRYMGREDDQVQVRGVRIELGEVEANLENAPGVKQAAVRTVEETDGRVDGLVAYVVLDEGAELNAEALRDYLRAHLQEATIPGHFVELDEMPMAPSGKIDRKSLPDFDDSEAVARDRAGDRTAPTNEIEQKLVELWTNRLDVSEVGIHENFYALGGDSIKCIQIVADARRMGLVLQANDFTQNPTIAELSRVARTSGPAVRKPAAPVTGEAPLSPIQRWFFEQELDEPDHWNQAFMFEVPAQLQPELMRKIFGSIVEHHDALRLRYEKTADGWTQFYANTEDDLPFEVIDLPSKASTDEIEATATSVQSRLDIEKGPVFRVACLRRKGEETNRLLVAVHHLVIDALSWRILFDDLSQALKAEFEGSAMKSPAKSTSYAGWTKALHRYAQSNRIQQELPYWRGVVDSEASGAIPRDVEAAAADNTYGSTDVVQFSLDRERTSALLSGAQNAYSLNAEEVLLTALGRVLSEWSGDQSVVVELEGHGRVPEAIDDTIDLSRTVGWFTTLFPFVLDSTDAQWPAGALRSVKDARRRVPEGGIGFGVLKYLGDAPELARLSTPDVSFNYLGEFTVGAQPDSKQSPVLSPAPESTGPTRAPQNRRPNLLGIVGSLYDGSLTVGWEFSNNFHSRSTIEKLSIRLKDALTDIAEHCGSLEVGEFTASDFDLADSLDEEQLSILAGQISSKSEPE